MIQNKSQGFTLLELLITLLIASILFMFCHHFNTLISGLSNECDANRFFNNLTFARNAAITGNQLITICPTEDLQHCTENWSNGYMVFYQQTQKEQPIKLLRYEKIHHLTHISSHQTSVLQFTGEGRSLHRATFDFNLQKPYKVVVYDSGRIRLSSGL